MTLPSGAAAVAPAVACRAAAPAVAAVPGRGAPALRPTSHSRIRVAWPARRDATAYCVFRDGLLVGATARTAHVDRMLWPETPYEYAVVTLRGRAVLAVRRGTASTTALPAAGFPRPFSRTSFWNTPIGPNRATHPRNDALMSYFVSRVRNPNVTLYEWGVSVTETATGDPVYRVPCTKYRCTIRRVPIPLQARPDPSGDGHLAVYDPARQREWGMWQARRARGGWQASAGAEVSTRGAGLAPPRTGAGNAANFPLLGGLIRPEEIAQGRIDHALVFGIKGIGRGRPVCPATHNASTTDDPNALREGQLLQLDPAVDVDALPVPDWQKTIARALQTYGMYLRDNSGSLAIYAETPWSRGYDPWAKLGFTPRVNPRLDGIPWDRMRVIAAPDYPNC